MIRGKTNNILLTPAGNKNIKPEETFIPSHIDIRNGHITDAGNWVKRPGYITKWDTGAKRSIPLLIPEKSGFAVTDTGKVFDLGSPLMEYEGRVYDTGPPLIDYTGVILGTGFRPQWVNHNEKIIICDGATPAYIDGINMRLVDGAPASRFIDTLDGYVLLANGTTFYWSAVDNNKSYPAANFNSVRSDGEKIVMMKVNNREIFFFKDYSIEVWLNVGSTIIFIRKYYINVIDKLSRRGRGIIGDTVVKANNTFYFFADGDFYVMDQYAPRIVGNQYRADIDTLTTVSDAYGFDCRKESCIRWFFPTHGKCYTYDYLHSIFSEDNIWEGSGWQRFPMNSYMELNNKQYFGDYNLTGKVYEFGNDFKDDNGLPIRVFRDLQLPFSSEGNQGRVNRLRFRMKRGVATALETNPKMLVRWKFDQDTDWTNYEEIDLGSIGDQNPYIDIYNLGIGHEIRLQISESDAVDYLLTAGFLTVEVLGA